MVNFFINIVSKEMIKFSYKGDKLLSKVMITPSFLMSTSKQASWSANAINLLKWSTKSSLSYIFYIKNLWQTIKSWINSLSHDIALALTLLPLVFYNS